MVERQSLTLAAQELLVSQPVVSAHIRDLEEFFGARLLYQEGRRMLLNEAGKAVHEYVIDVLASTEDTRDIVRLLGSADAGSAAIGATETPGGYRLPEQLTDFKLRYPKSEISLDIGSAFQVWEQTRHGLFDFSVVAGPEPPADLQVEIFSREPMALVCAPAHELAGRAIDGDELRRQPFLSLARRRVIDDRLSELGLETADFVMRLGNVEGLKHAVRAGLGLAVVYRCSVENELTDGTLAEVHVKDVFETRPFYLIHSLKKRFSPLQLRLLNFLRSWPRTRGR